MIKHNKQQASESIPLRRNPTWSFPPGPNIPYNGRLARFMQTHLLSPKQSILNRAWTLGLLRHDRNLAAPVTIHNLVRKTEQSQCSFVLGYYYSFYQLMTEVHLCTYLA